MDRRTWLLRLISARLIVFSIVCLMAQPDEEMLVLLGTVYAASLCWLALVRLSNSTAWQAYGQIGVDLFLITWTVNRSGGIDSSFSSLYFLEIVMASILLERRGAFFAATASSVIVLAHMDLAYFDIIPSTTRAWPDLPALQYLISLNIFGFCSVAYLSNFLSQNLRHTGAELKKSTGQVAFLQAFSDRIIDSLGSGLVTTDLEGNTYLFNHSAQDITGHTSDQALRMTVWQIFPGMLSKVEPARFEVLTTNRNGKEIYLRFSVSPILIDDKKTAGYVWCFDDQTELRVLERRMLQKEQMATIGTMSAGIAHEIRNPLSSITGSFKLLKSELTLDSDQQNLAEIITRETERLNRTITDFLSYARPVLPNPGTTEVSQIVTDLVHLMRNSAELAPNHNIETRLERIEVQVDESMIRQVFYNLASNAFKAMPEGGTLTITVERRSGGARIRFADTGIGLADDELKKLFVPFNSRFRNGTGLGLPIVYQIIAAHNGMITVKSRKGEGTAFVIDL